MVSAIKRAGGIVAAIGVLFGAGHAIAREVKMELSREVSVDFADRHPPFEGWGTSLCWWAHGVGGWDEKTVDDIVKLITDPDEGLGMNVFRYNIGGGDDPTHNHFRRWGDVPGFRATPDAPYDFTADANQRRVLLKLRDARSDAKFEAFSNSPPFWMTVSGCSAGAVDGGANLRKDRESDFAQYLVDVAAHYAQAHGIRWHTLEPFNEPDVDWWRAGKDQEGCHVPIDQQARIIRLTREKLDAVGLRSTMVSATDANSIDDALKSVRAYDASTLAALGQINAHSYAGTAREDLRELARKLNKPLWQSESGPLWVGGTQYEQIMKMAHRITLDINQMRPGAWLTWQVVAGGEWGCIHEDPEAKSFSLGKKFHMLRLFTRHIRPGDRFVGVKGDAVAALSEARGEAVIVLVNTDKSPVTFGVSLTGLKSTPARGSLRQTSAELDAQTREQVSIRSDRFELKVPPESVTQVLLRME